jgi:hypothetical protein
LHVKEISILEFPEIFCMKVANIKRLFKESILRSWLCVIFREIPEILQVYESFRYIKQCYNLEDIRVRHYTSIRNTVVFILAVSYFAAVYLGKNLKLKMLVERIYLVSKRFFGVPTFFNYAIADGLYKLLFPDKTGIRSLPKNKNPDFQLYFNFCDDEA